MADAIVTPLSSKNSCTVRALVDACNTRPLSFSVISVVGLAKDVGIAIHEVITMAAQTTAILRKKWSRIPPLRPPAFLPLRPPVKTTRPEPDVLCTGWEEAAAAALFPPRLREIPDVLVVESEEKISASFPGFFRLRARLLLEPIGVRSSSEKFGFCVV